MACRYQFVGGCKGSENKQKYVATVSHVLFNYCKFPNLRLTHWSIYKANKVSEKMVMERFFSCNEFQNSRREAMYLSWGQKNQPQLRRQMISPSWNVSVHYWKHLSTWVVCMWLKYVYIHICVLGKKQNASFYQSTEVGDESQCL